MNNAQQSRQLVQAYGGKVTIKDKLPPGVEWHVCLTQPTPNCVNHQGTCQRCGSTVYHATQTTIKKLCAPCAIALAKTTPLDAIATTQDLTNAILHHNRN